MSYNDPDMRPGISRGRGGFRGQSGGWPRGNRGGGNNYASPYGNPTNVTPYAYPQQSYQNQGVFRGRPGGQCNYGNRGRADPNRGKPYFRGQHQDVQPRSAAFQQGPSRGNYRGQTRNFHGHSQRGGNSKKVEPFDPKDYVIPKMTQNPWAKLESKYEADLIKEAHSSQS